MFRGFTKRIMDLGLKTKITLFISMIIIAFVVIMLFLLSSLGHTSIEIEEKALDQTTILLKQDLLNSIHTKAQIYDITFKNMIIDIESLKESIIDSGLEYSLLTKYYYKHQVISSVYFIDMSGSISVAPSTGLFGESGKVNLRQIEEFGFLYSGDENLYVGRWLGPCTDFKGTGEIMTYVLPVWENDSLSGAIAFDISIDTMFTNIVNIDPSESSYIFIVKRDGDFIHSSEKIYQDFGIPQDSNNIFDSTFLEEREILDIFSQTGKKEGVFEIMPGNETKIVAYSAITSLGGKIVTVSPLGEIVQVQEEKASEIQQALIAVSINSTIIMAIIIAFLIIISFYVSDKGMMEPITRLKDGIQRLEKTEFKSRIPVTSRDEIGDLTTSFNEMASNLSESRKKLEDYSKNLEKKVKERTKELEEKDKKLQSQNEELKRLDKEKDEFISIAAHELKTPLTSIKGFAQLMQDDRVMGDKEKRKHYLELVNQNTIRLYNLILDLVDSSRLSLGKLKLDIAEVDANKISNDIKDNMGMVIKEKGIKPVFTIQESLPSISADPERLMQVIRNLIVNATHFTPKGGTISLGITKKEGFVQFEIKDTGEGIPKEKQKNIFSRFYQADASLTRKVKGSGLGLSICQGLVELMGGKIWFKSTEGKGTAFYFTVPIYKGGAKIGKKDNDSG